MSPDEELAVGKEFVREAERIIDTQFHNIEELDDKGEHLTRLGVLVVILGLTLGSLIVTGDSPASPLAVAALVVVGAGTMAAVVALYFIIHSYSSLSPAGRRAAGPPNIGQDLVGKIRQMDSQRNLAWYLEGHVMGFAEAQQKNEAIMNDIVRSRRRGLLVLAGYAIPLMVVGMVLIVVLTIIS